MSFNMMGGADGGYNEIQRILRHVIPNDWAWNKSTLSIAANENEATKLKITAVDGKRFVSTDTIENTEDISTDT